MTTKTISRAEFGAFCETAFWFAQGGDSAVVINENGEVFDIRIVALMGESIDTMDLIHEEFGVAYAHAVSILTKQVLENQPS